MAIKTETFNLCKYIKTISIRNDLQSIINDLTFGEKGQFGYHARKQHAQFMGYLIVDEKRALLEDRLPTKLPALSPEYILLIRKGHSIIKHINSICSSIIIDNIPNLECCLDPYSLFPYPGYQQNVSDVLDNQTIQPLVNAFQNSKPVKEIVNQTKKLTGGSFQKNFFEGVIEIKRRIDEAGVHKTPKNFNESNRQLQEGSAEHSLLTLIYACISARAILSNIDQLIFQAILFDKLTVLDSDKIINIENWTGTTIGRGMTLLTQLGPSGVLMEPASIALIKFEYNGEKVDEIGLVTSVSFRMNHQTGSDESISLRLLDNDLNPYSNLLK